MDELNRVAFTLWGAGVTWAEVAGDVSGALCVWLVARQHLLNWPLGLANNVFWSVLFWNARLYADASLQVVFFALGVYGWWTWLYAGPGAANSLPVRRTSRREWIWLGLITLAATVAASAFLRRFTDSPVPVWDASVLTLSLAATYRSDSEAARILVDLDSRGRRERPVVLESPALSHGGALRDLRVDLRQRSRVVAA